MEIREDVGEHGLDSVMLISELDLNVTMNATPSQVDTAIALIKRMKHAFEVPQSMDDLAVATMDLKSSRLDDHDGVVVNTSRVKEVHGVRNDKLMLPTLRDLIVQSLAQLGRHVGGTL
eukprot:5929007-Pleurochrysis_carterae.AAC.1